MSMESKRSASSRNARRTILRPFCLLLISAAISGVSGISCTGGDEASIPSRSDTLAAPTFPSKIKKMTIAVKTSKTTNAGTDDATIQLCLTSSKCFTLNNTQLDDFENGALDEFVVDNVNLNRSSVTKMKLQVTSGSDMWIP